MRILVPPHPSGPVKGPRERNGSAESEGGQVRDVAWGLVVTLGLGFPDSGAGHRATKSVA